MKKRVVSILFVLLLICSISASAFAEAKTGYVTFTSAGKMQEQNFNVDQVFAGLEPGDTAKYDVVVANANSRTTRWYMSNTVISSLEASAAAGRIRGGAYDYKLTYKGPSGTTTTIYDSTSSDSTHFVGGDTSYNGRTGLREATGNLENFFYLDTLNPNEKGTVTLEVSLEGETQGNTYQNTEAEIKMNFAVELANSSTSTTTRTAVKTGDENNLVPYYVGMIVAGLLLLYLALDAVTDRMYQKGRR